jgi:hypothetical protein
MDKNMINIDDLVRQRLSGGEEEERAGAWLRMQELLDKEQPVRGAAYFSWKRIFSYAAGLVLLAAAGVAGYKATQTQADEDIASVNKYDRANNAMLSGAVVSNNTAGNTTGSSASDKKDVAANSHNDNARRLIKDNTSSKQSGMVASTGKDASTIAISKARNNTTINKNIPLNTVKSNTVTNNPTPENKPGNSNVIVTTPVAKAVDNNVQVNENKPSTTIANNNFAATKRNKTQQLPVEVTNPRYRKQIKTIDSVEVITTKESSRKGLRKIDTIAQGMVATEKLVDVPAEVAAAPATNKAPRVILPSATLMERNSPEVISASASLDSKAEKKQSKNAYNPRRFEEMVQNMKVDFGKVSFHPGLVAGISSSVGAYNMMGVQLGLVGIMNISDHWGMFAELKGIYRFGNGKSLINNYKDYTGINYIGNNTYSHEWDSVAHSFNISSSTSVELPIAVRYSANRLNAFVGVNGTYNFAVRVDEYTQKYSRSYVSNSTNRQEVTQQWGENPVIGYDAFKARFMLGYVVGAGYQVSPNIGIDFRATQPLMESNAGTKSTAIVSKQLYRAPSFQLNFTYKFSNNKYKPRELNY